jgi:uncharacterized membrane protein YGL010W
MAASASRPSLLAVVTGLLRKQHATDLQVYRDGHCNFANRICHWLLIPVETVTCLVLLNQFLLLLLCLAAAKKQRDTLNKKKRLLQCTFVQAINWTLGILSLIISPDATGLAAFFFHAGAVPRAKQQSLSSVAMAWFLSWILQICVGHWLLEGNVPTFQQNGGVSMLAVVTSVLIAWKS